MTLMRVLRGWEDVTISDDVAPREDTIGQSAPLWSETLMHINPLSKFV